MDGDAVGARDVGTKYPGAPGGIPHADPPVHDFGRVQVAGGVEGHIVGSDDVTALGADRVQLAGRHVERADLAAGHLGDVDAAVGTRAQTVGAEQPTGRGEPGQGPALGKAW
ncbi:hypothetical protein GCM10027213_02230 [Mycobacterium bourgelatii]